MLGAAGLVGVAATGVLVARQERTRRAYTPQEVRSRLHERYAQINQERDAQKAATQKAATQKAATQKTE